MDELPLISVIVPVYNVEKYLEKCLDSILAQTYPTLEVILIDDGSTDRSGVICDRYATSNPQIKVIHKPNGGLSSARNAGIRHSHGPILTFVDSDDWIAPNMIETLYRNMMALGADISSCSEFWLRDEISTPASKENTPAAMSPVDAISDMLYQNRLNHSTWGKLYRKSLFDNVDFPEGKIYEDLATFYPLYLQARKIAHTPSQLYYYRLREDSITGNFTLKRLDVLDVTDDIERHIAATHPQLLPAAHDRKLSANFNMMQLLSANGYGDSPHADRCWRNIKKLRYGSLVNPKVRVKNKLGIIASLFGRKAFQLICRAVS